jgi:pyridoxamine 5'-phosphate oxidase
VVEPGDLDGFRAERLRTGLDRSDLDDDPFVQFAGWLADAVAIGMHEPEAMVLSTATPAGIVSSRHVLLRAMDDGMFVFFTNYESQKAEEIAANPAVSLCFPWSVLGRQVRVAGFAHRSSPAVSDAYFATRERESQLGAWASPQSSVLVDRDELEASFAAAEARFAGGEVPRPQNWGGIAVVPLEVEFWQGRLFRLHDRFRYSRADPAGPWHIERLAP